MAAPSRSHGQRGPVATFAFRMVPDIIFFFLGMYFFFQDADVKKGAARRAAIVRMSARRRFKYHFRFTSGEILGYFLYFFFAPSLQTIA